MKSNNLLIKEVQRTPSMTNMKRSISRHKTIKLLKDKDKETKSGKRKVTHHVKASVDETVEARSQWNEIFKVLEKNCPTSILYQE